MLEFFEKNLPFLIFASMVAAFVIYSVKKGEKAEKEKQEKDTQKKIEESQKKEQ